jgi:hypothetical protein
MTRLRIPWTLVLLTLAATLAVAGGIAVGGEATLEDLARTQTVPSAAAGLLGPITESGRTGWECAPERAARARTAHAAGLPASTP